MSNAAEIDLETESIRLDGEWVTRDALWERMNGCIGAKDYKNISRLAGLLEQLDAALSGARSLSFKLGAVHAEKLSALAETLSRPLHLVARELLEKALDAQTPAAPAAEAEPVPLPPTPAPSVGDEGPALQPRRPELAASIPLPAPTPPVMTPVAPPSAQPSAQPSVVVAPPEEDKSKTGGESRRWFNRTT